MKRLILVLLISVTGMSAQFLLFTGSLLAQVGGQFDLSHNIIASGGGSNSAGGSYRVDGTVGQAIAGVQTSGGAFSLSGGFWTPPSFAPTAAGVSVAGRVTTAEGYGIGNSHITLTNLSTGESRIAQTSSFGFYRFDDVPVGELYSLTINSKRYTFDPNTRVISLVDEVTDADFVAVAVN